MRLSITIAALVVALVLAGCSAKGPVPAPVPEQGAAWATSPVNVNIWPPRSSYVAPESVGEAAPIGGVSTTVLRPLEVPAQPAMPDGSCGVSTDGCEVPLTLMSYPPQIGPNGQPVPIRSPSAPATSSSQSAGEPSSSGAQWLVIGVAVLAILGGLLTGKVRTALVIAGGAFASVFFVGCNALGEIGKAAQDAMIDTPGPDGVGWGAPEFVGGGGILATLLYFGINFARNYARRQRGEPVRAGDVIKKKK
jgi:hypothetical protein